MLQQPLEERDRLVVYFVDLDNLKIKLRTWYDDYIPREYARVRGGNELDWIKQCGCRVIPILVEIPVLQQVQKQQQMSLQVGLEIPVVMTRA